MKTILIIMAVSSTALFLVSCGTMSHPTTGIDQPAPSISAVTTKAPTPTPTAQSTPTPSSTSSLKQNATGIVYKDKALGFQLTFPNDWDSYFKIIENTNGIAVNFYGKSKTGSISLQDFGIDGLPMFIITNHLPDENEEPLDSIQKIGTVNGTDYYYATGTSSGLGVLFDIADPQSAVRQTAKYTVDQTELNLAAQDWEKAQAMQSELDDVLKSFAPIAEN